MKGKKTGGRQVGSVNKVTAISKDIIAELLSEYKSSGLMDSDFRSIDPKDRLQIAEKLMNYIMPKVQSVAIDLNQNEQKKTIEDELAELSKDPENI